MAGPHQAYAQCPMPDHDDRTESLSITYEPEHGRTLVCCHAPACGARGVEIADAYGHPRSDLYDSPWPKGEKRSSGTRQKPARRTPVKRAPVKVAPTGPVCLDKYAQHAESRIGREPVDTPEQQWHTITDAEGTVVAWKIRLRCRRPGCGAKTRVAWRYPDSTGCPSYGKDAPKPAEMPLYGLPAVREAITSGEPIYLTEGETDADAVTTAGAVACTHGAADNGTGNHWRPWHTASLVGASEVIVCQDRDDPGRVSAQYIAQQLTAAGIPARIVEPAEGKDVRDHLTAGLTLDQLRDIPIDEDHQDHAETKQEGVPDRHEGHTVDNDEDHQGDEVTPGQQDADHQSIDLRDEPINTSVEIQPGPRLPMSRDTWAYATGDGQFPRGVYIRKTDDNKAKWFRVAPLPYIQARIVRRDGAGRRAGTDYLISATQEEPGVIVGHLKLRDGSWANELGLPLSDDDRIGRATSTAIREHAQSIPEREAVARVAEDGSIISPLPEMLPNGYLTTSPTERTEALTALAEIIRESADSPTIALTMGAAAIAPYVRPLDRQSHVLHHHSPEGGQGKSTTVRMGAGLWGDPFTDGGVLTSWNTTAIGMNRWLGMLGILPAFLDESGMTGWDSGQWGKTIFELTEGASRRGAEAKGPGIRTSAPWGGILVSSGNARITAGINASRFAGVFRRVIELGAPFTRDADHAERLDVLMKTAWGHPGVEILARYSRDDADKLINQAEQEIGLPANGAQRTIARHVASHVAGARILDEIAGTGTTLADATMRAALAILDGWTPPEHAADRLLTALLDSISRHASAWPTIAEYRELKRPRPDTDGATYRDPSRVDLPQHGYDREIIGVRADDGTWIAVFTKPLDDLCDVADLGDDDKEAALTELHERGVLVVPAAKRKAGKWQAQIRLEPVPARPAYVYRLALSLTDDENDAETSPGEPVSPPCHPTCHPHVTPDVTPENMPLTSSVTRVTPNSSSELSREQDPATIPDRCPGCGETVAETVREAGEGWHLMCAPPDLAALIPQRLQALRQATEAPAPPRAPQPPATAHTAPTGHRRGTCRGVPARQDPTHDTALGVLAHDGNAYVLHRRDTAPVTLTEVQGTRAGVHALALAHGLRTLAVHVSAATALGWPTEPQAMTGRGSTLSVPGWTDAEDGRESFPAGGVASWVTVWVPGEDGHRQSPVGVHVPCLDDRPAARWRDAQDGEELLSALVVFRSALGDGYYFSPNATGVQVARKHSRGLCEVELPPPARRNSGEGFRRAMVTIQSRPLTDTEDSQIFVHEYDINGQHISAMGGELFGNGAVTHLDSPVFDPKRAGYWRISNLTGWDTRMPRLSIEDGSWIVTATGKLLRDLGCTFDVTEAWVYERTHRPLEAVYRVYRDARTQLLDAEARGVPGAGIARKSLPYATFTGYLSRKQGQDTDRELYRPDWHDVILAEADARLLRRVHRIGTVTDRWPVGVKTDALFYTSDEDDPFKAAPAGLPLGTGLGQFKPEGTAPLAAMRDMFGENGMHRAFDKAAR